ncbi:NGG1p interacting factor NIF3 [Nitrincola sp.]|uniref:NGG1p interacting factor NIF3 n=1 Tax=Nitrincola sp. TaxID=1926584 RepID=UPI003A8DD0F6
MYLVVVYVPESHVDELIESMSAAGAGRIGDYDQCAWKVLGQGQFRPLAGANPHIGAVGALERVPEYRVEMVCEESVIKAVMTAMLTAHPYEEPAHHVLPIKTAGDW